MSKLYVGIDVSLRKNNVHCMAADGDTLKKFKVPNTFDGALALADNIVELSARHSLQEVILGMEATSNYGYLINSVKEGAIKDSLLFYKSFNSFVYFAVFYEHF